MKNLSLVIALCLFPLFAQAETVKSEKVDVNLARVVDIYHLNSAEKETQASIVVRDLGGSTDLSPTQEIYLTLYRKGEMFSTDATFRLDSVLYVTGVKARADGRYEVKAKGFRNDQAFADLVYVIDARGAVKAMGQVTCEDFDCEASENFATTISVVKK